MSLSARGETASWSELQGKPARTVSDPRRPHDPPWRERTAHRWLSPQLAAALREARLARGWSFRQAARELGVSPAGLHHLEHGVRLPSTVMAEVLIHGLGLDELTARRLRAVARPCAGRSSPFRSGDSWP